MKIICHRHLADFEFWGPAILNIKKLTLEEVSIVNDLIEDLYPDGIEEMMLNDWFAYYFDDILIMLGKEPEE